MTTADAAPRLGTQLTYDDFVPVPEFSPWYEAAVSFSADGEEIAFVAATSELFTIFRQPVAGGPAQAVTDGDGWFVHTAYWSPDGRWIAYSAAPTGAEEHDIFIIAAQGVAADGSGRIQVTDVPTATHRLPAGCWSPDSRYLAYSGNDRRRGAVDLLVYDLRAGQSRRLMAGDSFYHPRRWSPDSRRLLAVEERAMAETNLHVVDVVTGAAEEVTQARHGVTIIPGPWLPDSDQVVVVSNLGGEFMGLATLDVGTRKIEWLSAPFWDVERVVGSRDGSTLAWTVNENGFSKFYLYRPELDDEPVLMPEVARGGMVHGLALSADGRRAAVVTSGSARTYELSVLDTADRGMRGLVGGLPPRIHDYPLVEAEPVGYTSFDGVTIHGYLMRPTGRDRAGVVIALHGGPHIQERPNYGYSGMYQYLLARGIGVFLPNIRGSSGYGASFERLLVRRYGLDDVADVDAANEYLCSLEWVDRDRIGLFGFCYGGFAALGALVRSPDRWRTAACWGASCDLLDLIEGGTPEEHEARLALIGDPDLDREELIARSPLTHVDRIRAPLFLIHGQDDPQVPRRQSDRLAEAVRANGVPVEFQGQDGHGFADADSLYTACRDTANFLIRQLGPDAPLLPRD